MSDAPTKLLILGTGALAKAAMELVAANESLKVSAIIDTGDGSMVGEEFLGIRVQGDLSDLPRYKIQGAKAVFPACDDPAEKTKALEAAAKVKYQVIALRHPSAIVADSAKLGEGGFIGAGVIIGAEAKIGRGCSIGAGAIIEAGATVGEGCSIAAGAVIGPNANVAAGTAVGLGEVVA
ncbi:MAG: hypothetical protein KDB82_08730 [Planctomycetes bacterium]|nr:hypothetical protein [Planctomycetota bacterium]